jgi:hypothetical protein
MYPRPAEASVRVPVLLNRSEDFLNPVQGMFRPVAANGPFVSEFRGSEGTEDPDLVRIHFHIVRFRVVNKNYKHCQLR